MKFSVKTTLVIIALRHGIDPVYALDETFAVDFRRMVADARKRRFS